MDARLTEQLAERKAERGRRVPRDPPIAQDVAALASAQRQPKDQSDKSDWNSQKPTQRPKSVKM